VLTTRARPLARSSRPSSSKYANSTPTTLHPRTSHEPALRRKC
jgi:hypothetical protein